MNNLYLYFRLESQPNEMAAFNNAYVAPMTLIYQDSETLPGAGMVNVIGVLADIPGLDVWMVGGTSANIIYEVGGQIFEITLFDHTWGTEVHFRLDPSGGRY